MGMYRGMSPISQDFIIGLHLLLVQQLILESLSLELSWVF